MAFAAIPRHLYFSRRAIIACIREGWKMEILGGPLTIISDFFSFESYP